MNTIPVYLEIGQKRVFAAAIEWPGWCRSGRHEAIALEELIAYGPRYARAMGRSRQGFESPKDVKALRVIERLEGDSTTDFGAPGKIPAQDMKPISASEVERQHALLRACWATLDRVAEKHADAELRKGPRGGGRDLVKIRAHVLGAEASYLTQLGGKLDPIRGSAGSEPARIHEAFLDALAASARGEVAAKGPRGGRRWPPPYAARRAAWHVLDHMWEIEDRAG